MPFQFSVFRLVKGREVLLTTKKFQTSEITVGSSPENDLVIDDESVSAEHALIRLQEHKRGITCYVTDLGSEWGTRIERHALAPHMEVEVNPNKRLFVSEYIIRLEHISEDMLDAAAPVPDNEAFEHLLKRFSEEHQKEREPLESEHELAAEGFIDEVPDPEPELYQQFEASSNLVTPMILEELVEPLAPEEPEETMELREAMPSPIVKPRQSQPKSSPDEESPAITFSIGAEDTFRLELVATRVLSVQGAVVDPEGAPLPGITLYAGDNLPKQVTDSEGRFFFEDIAEDTYIELVPHGASMNFSPERWEGELTEPLELIFVAEALGLIRGVVRHNFSALSGVTIDAGAFGVTRTDENGMFQFSEVPLGKSFHLQIAKEGYRFEPCDIQGILDEDELELQIQAEKLVTVSGVISHRGKPLQGVSIDAGDFGTTLTDDRGVFTFYEIPEGSELTLQPRKEGFMFAKQTLRAPVSRATSHEEEARQ